MAVPSPQFVCYPLVKLLLSDCVWRTILAAVSMTGVAGVFNLGLSTYISCPGDKACTAIGTFDDTGIAVKRIALVVSRIDNRTLLH